MGIVKMGCKYHLRLHPFIPVITVQCLRVFVLCVKLQTT